MRWFAGSNVTCLAFWSLSDSGSSPCTQSLHLPLKWYGLRHPGQYKSHQCRSSLGNRLGFCPGVAWFWITSCICSIGILFRWAGYVEQAVEPVELFYEQATKRLKLAREARESVDLLISWWISFLVTNLEKFSLSSNFPSITSSNKGSIYSAHGPAIGPVLLR